MSFLRAIFRVVEKLRQHSPKLKYYCDPVLGDNGKLYVPEELVAVYRAEVGSMFERRTRNLKRHPSLLKVLRHVSVLFPNQYELELLAEQKVQSIGDVQKAFDTIHGKGVETIVLTSCEVASEGKMALFASTRESATSDRVVYKATFARIPGHFTGTGDLIAALLVAW